MEIVLKPKPKKKREEKVIRKFLYFPLTLYDDHWANSRSNKIRRWWEWAEIVITPDGYKYWNDQWNNCSCQCEYKTKIKLFGSCQYRRRIVKGKYEYDQYRCTNHGHKGCLAELKFEID